MLINFSNEGLISEISSDKISLDNHDVTNLISLDENVKKKGFLVGNFIRPPVCVKLKFVCDINIKQIIINGRVGVQKSSGFEIYTARENFQEISVAKGTIGDKDNSLEFLIHGANSKMNNVSFKSSKFLNKIRTVIIKIFSTEGSTLPALGKVEVWGSISKHVNPDMSTLVFETWKNITKPQVYPQSSISVKNEKETPVRFRYTRPIPTVDIPEEYVDPITCDIMTIPMTLPSGKIVDVSTLEKFYEVEKEFGRGRSDPFTGLLFTDDSKPVVATSLKGRMDKFLLKNSHIDVIKAIPRALGSNPCSQLIAKESPGPSNLELQYSKNSISPAQQKSTTIKSTPANKRNINQLLESTLSGLPSFLNVPEKKKIKNVCMKCSEATTLFKMNCEHIVCRNCLSEMKDTKINDCIYCNKKIDYNKVSRYHTAQYL